MSSRRRGPDAIAAIVAIVVFVTLVALGTALAVEDGSRVEQEPQLAWWTVDALVKVRPDAEPPEAARRSTGAELVAARNEFEPFQLVLRSEGERMAAVDIEATELVPEGGAQGGRRLPASLVAVYLERFVRLTTPSIEGLGKGEWPDPLLPRGDLIRGERDSASKPGAFPFELEPGRSQPIWIEVFVPPDAPAGIYRSELRVTSEGRLRIRIPWRLEVLPFALPSTSSLPTTFGFSGIAAIRRHHGGFTDDAELLALTRAYSESALRHRISLHGGTQVAPPARFVNGRAEIDWSRYDEEVGPLLDGTLFGPGEPLAGARATTVEIRTLGGLDDQRTVAYWKAFAEHLRERGWLDRAFLYLWDEPTESDYPEVLRRGRLARSADPEIRVLLTEPYSPELASVVDLWVPVINCLESRPGNESPCGPPVPRQAYAEAERRGGELWWYQSCASHGCGVVGGRELSVWPSYVIDAPGDAPGVAHRVMPWLAFERGISGELYYNTVEAYGDGADPWDDPRRHGGNGDGTLFYPGTPRRIGGARQAPIESVRLKLIREGLEDYEYLALRAAQVGIERVRGEVAELLPANARRLPTAEELRAARASVARAVADGSGR